MGIDLLANGAVNITQFQISTVEGDLLKTELPLGGFGISRYAFDALLYKRATELGVHFYFEKVIKTEFKEDKFSLSTGTGTFLGKIAIGAYGKSNILFTNNTFENFRGDKFGGAVNIYDSSSAYFKDNFFQNNFATTGGAV